MAKFDSVSFRNPCLSTILKSVMPFIEDDEDICHELLKKRKVEEESNALKQQEQAAIDQKLEAEKNERTQSWISSGSSQSSSSTLVASPPPLYEPSAEHLKEMERYAAFFEENKEEYNAIKLEQSSDKSELTPPASIEEKKKVKKRRLGVGRPPALKIKKPREIVEEEERAEKREKAMYEMRYGPHRELYSQFLDQIYIRECTYLIVHAAKLTFAISAPPLDLDEGEY